MSFLNQVGVLILTCNEAPNIGRTLESLVRFPEVVVLDSGSTDGTLDIVARYPNARSVIRPFVGHAAQWQHGLTSCGLARPWLLALDADYMVPAALVDEIAGLAPGNDVCGHRAAFRYCIHGRPLSGSLYQPHIVLFRRDRARYVQQGHTQRVVVDGRINALAAPIYHDDRKPLSRWLSSQQEYARREADYLLATPRAQLRRSDRIRRMGWPAPILVLLYTLIVKRCLLDGWTGWLYVLQRTVAEMLIALELAERRLQVRPKAK